MIYRVDSITYGLFITPCPPPPHTVRKYIYRVDSITYGLFITPCPPPPHTVRKYITA